jgi:iron complex outermembrane receptor protein
MTDVRDIQYAVPALTVGETVGMMKVTLRSLGNASNTRGEDSQVAFHVDGAVVSRPEAQALTLFDVERIEVLKGPQGTLYGRNATGGAINVVTMKPSEDLNGYVNRSGNYNLMGVDGRWRGDQAASSVAWRSQQSAVTASRITTNNELDDLDRWAARGQLEFKFDDNLRWLVGGEYATEHDATGLFTYLTPLYVVNTDTFPPPASQDPKGLGGLSDPDSRDGAGNIDPIMDRQTLSLTSTLTWDINDNLTLKDIANYRYRFYLAGTRPLVGRPAARSGVRWPSRCARISGK